MKIVYFSLTGQTRRFVKKLDFPSYEIEQRDPFEKITEPYVLIVPTYDLEITEVVNDFIDYEDNRTFLKGVVGSGNRNFADLFVFTAKDIARDYHVPMLFAFEFNGTPEDVENFKKVVSEIDLKKT